MNELMLLALGTYTVVFLIMVRELLTCWKVRRKLLEHKVLTNRGWIEKEEITIEEVHPK